MKKICIISMLLVLLLLASCGDKQNTQETAPTPATPESSVEDATDPLSRIVIVMQDSRVTPKSKDELASALTEMASLGADGECNVLLQVYGEGNTDSDLKDYIQKQDFYYQNSLECDVIREYGVSSIPYGVFAAMSPTFFYDVAAFAKVERVEIILGSATVVEEFPFEVGYYAGNAFYRIQSTDELASCLAMLQGLCGEGKPYGGIGVRLYGYEVQKGDVSGLPYCHLSHGTKDDPLTVFGFKYDVLGELDATVVSDLLRMCPYFTKAEFYLVTDPTNPELVM